MIMEGCWVIVSVDSSFVASNFLLKWCISGKSLKSCQALEFYPLLVVVVIFCVSNKGITLWFVPARLVSVVAMVGQIENEFKFQFVKRKLNQPKML